MCDLTSILHHSRKIKTLLSHAILLFALLSVVSGMSMTYGEELVTKQKGKQAISLLRQEVSPPEVIRPIPGTQTNPIRVGNYYMMLKFWHPDASKFCFRTAGGGKVYQETWRGIDERDSMTGYYYEARHFKGGGDRPYVFDVRTDSGDEVCGSQEITFGDIWARGEVVKGVRVGDIPEFDGFITIKEGDRVQANRPIYVAVECQDPDGGFIDPETHAGVNDLNGVLSVTLKIDGKVFETKKNTEEPVAGNETSARGFGLYEFWVTMPVGKHTLQIETVDRENNHRVGSRITVDAQEGAVPQPPEFGGPIRGDAYVGESFTASIAGTARDLDGDALTYSKLSGPDWLNVEGDGSISGTPRPGDAGMNTFTLGVHSADGTDEGMLRIKVLPESAVLIGNDFEAETVGSQPGDFIYDTIEGSAEVVAENGNQYLRIKNTSYADDLGNVLEQSFNPQSGLVTVQLRMRASGAEDQVYLCLFDADGNCALQVGCSGELQRGNGLHKYLDPESTKSDRLETFRPKSWYEKGIWYSFRIEADVNTQRYRFWVNDIEMLPQDKDLTDFPFYTSTGAITRFELTNLSAKGTFDIDSISIRGGRAYNTP